MTDLYAHTPNDKGEWHKLEDHLKEVSLLAEKFAAKFNAGDLAKWIGLWHDLGKIHPAFQEYLKKCEGEPDKPHRGPDHKGAGSVLALKALEPLAFLIAGHHWGLRNREDLKLWLTEKSSLSTVKEALTMAANEGYELSPSSLLHPSFVKDNLDADFFL